MLACSLGFVVATSQPIAYSPEPDRQRAETGSSAAHEARATADPASDPPAARFGVLVTAVLRDDVPGLTWTEAIRECQRIWRRERIDVEWSGHTAAGAPDRQRLPVTVYFDEGALRKQLRNTTADDLGITVFEGRDHHVIVSTRRARRLLEGAASVGAANLMLGRLLGRVVAHEIGHVLLLSTAHSSTGLMRRQVAVADLGVAHDGPVSLAEHESRRILTFLENGTVFARIRAAAPIAASRR